MDRRLLGLLTAVLLLGFLLTAVAMNGHQQAFAARTYSVKMVKDDRFYPRYIKIHRYSYVRWYNADRSAHTSTSRYWNARVSPGRAYARQFRSLGTYRYYCRFHSGMTGTVVVVR